MKIAVRTFVPASDLTLVVDPPRFSVSSAWSIDRTKDSATEQEPMALTFTTGMVISIRANNIAGGVDAIGAGSRGAWEINVCVIPTVEQEGMADLAQKILPDNRAG